MDIHFCAEGNIVRFGTSSRKYLVVRKSIEGNSSEDITTTPEETESNETGEKRASSMMSIHYILEPNENEEDFSYNSSPKKKKANKNE
jgi:hypothetical protein